MSDPEPRIVSPADLWCDHCNRLVEAAAAVVDDEGEAHCPHCSEALSGGSSASGDDEADGNCDDEADGDEESAPKAPWHFKVLLVGTVIYLIYRLIWFIFWISHHA